MTHLQGQPKWIPENIHPPSLFLDQRAGGIPPSGQHHLTCNECHVHNLQHFDMLAVLTPVSIDPRRALHNEYLLVLVTRLQFIFQRATHRGSTR